MIRKKRRCTRRHRQLTAKEEMIKLYSENFEVALYKFKARVASAVNSKRFNAPVRAFSVLPVNYWVETKKEASIEQQQSPLGS